MKAKSATSPLDALPMRQQLQTLRAYSSKCFIFFHAGFDCPDIHWPHHSEVSAWVQQMSLKKMPGKELSEVRIQQ